ncbi:aldehyde reductase-like protein [Euroglyphus maynei]|uniref:Aldehyde reductase-like protein n=1 Tax=Euroglyphus maynei TaxID=6958 RepID=A0A1Y3BG62_EURMA|nr:aldehyde reductase-like protein [Euroglyphus maynei]
MKILLLIIKNFQAAKINKTIQLKNGHHIPVVGLGTSRIAPTDEQIIQAIKNAIDVELAIQSVRQSLANLRLEYLDLVLIHWPMSFQSGGEKVPKFPNGTIIGSDLSKENFELAYQGLEDACDQNLTRSIGVSNFNIKQLDKLLSANNRRHEPMVNQVECHPHLNQEKLLKHCHNNGIRLVAYSPLRRGNTILFDEPKLKQIAHEHNRTIAQIILRWQLQRDVIIIPRTSKKHRMLENISLFDFHLNQTEMSTIMSLDRSNNTGGDDDGREIRFESASHLSEFPFVKN